ncbi:hypothetical protein MJO28_006555 [Puccinia striiformis f. sp. tritici]|uniref:Uncharacterized protein n=1 Tax=Puccinia striiformis f. sp. tritici TaxID=168172 RepID=A0ACC0EHT5_9BASI|nr:hypothetical protein MJO28_006555 [Puccinia striiformis f. sp. tritici]
MWNAELLKRKWATLVDIQDSKSFLFAFQSVWQKKMMQNHRGGMLMIDATHNTVANNFMEGKLKISLYTVMLHDPIVGKGLPVAWAFTLAESHEPVRRLLSWLQDTSGSRLQSVMSDCALAIANAVAHTFPPLSGDCTKHYWCLFHVFKAFKAKAKTLLPGRADEAYQAFRKIVYSPLDPNLSLISFWLCWREVSPVFGSYVWKQWIWRLTHWSMFFQTTAHQGVHTNPYTEAWHRVLKDEYIRPRACKRIDEVLHILIHEIEPKYRWSQLQVANGFVGQTINKFQHCMHKTLGIQAVKHTSQVSFSASHSTLTVVTQWDKNLSRAHSLPLGLSRIPCTCSAWCTSRFRRGWRRSYHQL